MNKSKSDLFLAKSIGIFTRLLGGKGSYDTSDFLLRLRIDLRPHKADLDIHWRPFPLSENLPAGIPEIKIAAANVRGLHNRKLTEFHVPAIFQ